MMGELTAERARELFDYDAETGILTWKIRPSKHARMRFGDEAGSLDSGGYLQTTVFHKKYKNHRIIWLLVNGRWPEEEIDHVNGVRDDNRISNLREATHQENQRNRKLPKNNKSGVIGVSWNKARFLWVAHIRLDGKLKYLGAGTDLTKMARLRKAAEIKYGFDPNHGRGT